MDVERKQKDFKALSKVVSKSELTNINLTSFSANRSIDALKYNNIGAKIKFKGSLFEEHKNDFVAKIIMSVKGLAGDGGEKEILKIDAEYLLYYSLKDKEGISTEDITVFCEMNALYNVWPFWRELTNNLSQRMNLPPLTLPLLKFKPTKTEKKVTSEKNKS